MKEGFVHMDLKEDVKQRLMKSRMENAIHILLGLEHSVLDARVEVDKLRRQLAEGQNAS